jgi:hypothetical protein
MRLMMMTTACLVLKAAVAGGGVQDVTGMDTKQSIAASTVAATQRQFVAALQMQHFVNAFAHLGTSSCARLLYPAL